jgi:hypothetical protein
VLADDVGRRPLEKIHLACGFGNRRDELDGAGAGADHADPPAQIDVVPPAGTVEHRSGEPVQAGDQGPGGHAELAGGRDHDVGRTNALGTVGGPEPDPPEVPVVVPGAVDGLGSEPQVGAEFLAADDVLEVGEDLVLVGEPAAPVGLAVERERVEVGGGVALGARIGVRPPDPTDPVRAVDDQQVVVAVPKQPDRRGDPAGTGADHQDSRVPGRHRSLLTSSCGVPGCALHRAGDQAQGSPTGLRLSRNRTV